MNDKTARYPDRLAQDATAHDPKNGQFASGSGGGSAAKAASPKRQAHALATSPEKLTAHLHSSIDAAGHLSPEEKQSLKGHVGDYVSDLEDGYEPGAYTHPNDFLPDLEEYHGIASQMPNAKQTHSAAPPMSDFKKGAKDTSLLKQTPAQALANTPGGAKDGGPGSGPHKVGTAVTTESGETGTISHVRESNDPAYPHKYRVTSSQKTPEGYSQHVEQGHYINHGRLTPTGSGAKDEAPKYEGRNLDDGAQSMPTGFGSDGQWKF